MTQYAATNVTVWPSANDIAPTLGNGKLLLELKLTPWRLGMERNYVISGFQVPDSSTNLDLSVPTGTAFVGGYYVNIPGSTTITCINGTNFLYLILNRDGNGKVLSAAFDRIASEFINPDYCLLAVAEATGGVITATLDARSVAPFSACPWGGVNVTGPNSNYAKENYVMQLGNTGMGGLRLYSAFRLLNGVTITVNQSALVLVSDRCIDIGGFIDATATGVSGGAGGTSPVIGTSATDQPGGGGGGNGVGITGARGGDAGINGVALNIGGAGGGGNGAQGTQVAGTALMRQKSMVEALGGGAGGGGGGGSGGGTGGTGGGSIVLIAPIVRLRLGAELRTNGSNGGNGSGNSGGGGGGAAGNIWVICRKGFFLDDGCTFTQNPGGAGAGAGTGNVGAAGQTGVREFLEIL